MSLGAILPLLLYDGAEVVLANNPNPWTPTRDTRVRVTPVFIVAFPGSLSHPMMLSHIECLSQLWGKLPWLLCACGRSGPGLLPFPLEMNGSNAVAFEAMGCASLNLI